MSCPSNKDKVENNDIAAIRDLPRYLNLSRLTITLDISFIAHNILLNQSHHHTQCPAEIIRRFVAGALRVQELAKLKDLKRIKLTYRVKIYVESLSIHTDNRIAKNEIEFIVLITMGEIEEELNAMLISGNR